MRRMKKSRNGCSRCKGQRLKCDEAKPACGRCVRVGVQCPGYESTLKWSTKYEVLQPEAEVRKQQRQRRSKWPGTLFEECFEQAHRQQSQPPTISSPCGEESPNDSSACFDWNTDVGRLDHSSIDDIINDGSLPLFSVFFPDEGVNVSSTNLPIPSPPAPQDLYNNSNRITSASNDLLSSVLRFDQLSSSTSLQASKCPASRNDAAENLHSSQAEPTKITSTRPVPVVFSSMLVEFYFKETAQMYSCYDSQMNPFRSTVSRLWTSSPVLHSTLQSMAASCLIETFPQMARLGRQLRMEAVSMLSPETLDDHSLLALMMLGGTANWTDPKDLGIPLFNAFKSKLSSVSRSNSATNNLQFFQDSLVYWEMLLCYVSDSVDVSHVPLTNATQIYFPSKHVPHPWTGIARDTQLILQEVGRLVRRQRMHAHSRAFVSLAQIKRLQQAMASAEELESRLMNIVIPNEADVISTEDRDTPVWHLLDLAEVYRRTGLVQLYHVFPDLLSRRLGSRQTEVASASLAHGESFLEEQNLHRNQVRWLTRYAMDTLGLLKRIPVGSGTRDFQPFLLVALSSELRLPLSKTTNTETEDEVPTLFEISTDVSPSHYRRHLELSTVAIEVARMREFVHSRLSSFLHGLPPSPIRVCLQLVKEIWAQMDSTAIKLAESNRNGQEERDGSEDDLDGSPDDEVRPDIYWMDVMIQNKWEFVV